MEARWTKSKLSYNYVAPCMGIRHAFGNSLLLLMLAFIASHTDYLLGEAKQGMTARTRTPEVTGKFVCTRTTG